MDTKAKQLLSIGVAGALFVVTAATATADEVVKIGHVAPLSGGQTQTGKDSENGARLAVEEINKKGLVIGGTKVTLELDTQDDAGDPRQATQVAQKLVDDKVVGVVGHLNSGTSIPASKIYSDAGIAEISPAATNPAYTLQGFKTTFRVVATDAQQGPALAKFAQSTGIKSVAVVDDSTAYGQGLANEFEKRAEALGLKVVSHDATSDKAVDFRAVLTKIKGESPDAIMYGGAYATGGPFAKQATQLGINAKIFAGDGVCVEQLADLGAGAGADRVVCSEAGAPLEKMPGGAAFKTKFEKRFGQPIQIYAPFAYDAVYIIVDAMKRANSADPSKILASLPSTNYNGVIGNVQFDEHGDLKHGVISLYSYKAGKKTLIDEVSM